MKKLLLATAALALFTGAYAKKVKFRVDMTGQTVDANGVHIAGDFQAAAGAPGDWQPGATAMSNGGSGNIYSVIVDIPSGRKYEFKFINGNDWPQAENIPAINQVGHTLNGGSNGNRWFYIDSVANDTTVLPAILFSGSAPSGQHAVRFAVDMQKEAAVNVNGVHIAGEVQTPQWQPGSTSMINLFNNNKVYEYIAYLPSGTYQYKYVNGNNWDPGNPETVPASCESSAGSGNRGITVSADSSLKVCFASCTACPAVPLPTYTATFRVDMTNSDCDGGFDSVTVSGGRPEITNWGNGIRLNKVGATNVYALTLTLDSGEVQFKFRYHKNGNTNWEGGDNRVWALSKNDSTPLHCFGARVACVAKPAPSTIIFMVDMTNEIPDAQGRIFVEGTFQTPNWKPGAIRMQPVSGQPGIYSVTVNNVCPGTFNYKFMNGDSTLDASEENYPDTTSRGCLEPSGVGGYNRVYTRTSANAVTLFYVFNRCDAGTPVGIKDINVLATHVRMYPNPANTYTAIEFNDNALSHTVTITNLAGQVVRQLTTKENMIRQEGLGSGMYLVNITNSNAEAKVLKLIVQ